MRAQTVASPARDTGEKQPLDFLKDKQIGALSAIAAPESFENALTQLGAQIDLARHFADHHRFTEKELSNFATRCLRRDVTAIITTEKDSVRLPRIGKLDVPIYFLRVEIDILTGHESWQHLVDRLCKPQPFIVLEEMQRFFSAREIRRSCAKPLEPETEMRIE